MSTLPGSPVPGNRWDLLDGVEPTPAPFVSVIVAHYRQPEQLARTLAALGAQDHPADRLEVVVADDGSPEPPVVPPGVRVVRQDDRGFRLAAVRNRGAGAATGDVLVFLDADTVPEPGFVRALTRLPALIGDCVTVGRRRHADLTGVPPLPDVSDAARERVLPEPEWLARHYRQSHDLLDVDDRSYRFLIGAVLACSRGFFDDVGGFDEGFRAYGGEDWEWAYRCWLRGAVFAHVPDAVAWHDGPDAGGRGAGDETVRGKNAEAIRLADLIPVAGSRGRGIRPEHADVVVTSPDPRADAAWFLAVDGALAALPEAEHALPREVVPREVAPREAVSGAVPGAVPEGRFDRVRIRVELRRPVLLPPERWRAAVARVTDDQLGELLLTDRDGVALAVVASVRAESRARRWARGDLFPRVVESVADAVHVPADVDLEAALGGWGLRAPG